MQAATAPGELPTARYQAIPDRLHRLEECSNRLPLVSKSASAGKKPCDAADAIVYHGGRTLMEGQGKATNSMTERRKWDRQGS